MTARELVQVKFGDHTVEEILWRVASDDRHPDAPPLEEIPIQSVVAFLKMNDEETVKESFNINLLRSTIEWAEKSAQLGEVNGITHDQSTWSRIWHAPMDMFQRAGEILPSIGTYYTAPREKIKEGFCQTAGCIAGNIAMELGEPLWERDGSGVSASYVYDQESPTGLLSVEFFAKNQLGITTLESQMLFAGENTTPELVHLSTAYSERRGLTF